MLEDILKKLGVPEERQEDVYKTELIKGTLHRVGKNYKGLPSYLLTQKKMMSQFILIKG